VLSDTWPEVVPLSITLTPFSGFPFSSVIAPEMVLVCEKTQELIRSSRQLNTILGRALPGRKNDLFFILQAVLLLLQRT
jgi:hypothetical protein